MAVPNDSFNSRVSFFVKLKQKLGVDAARITPGRGQSRPDSSEDDSSGSGAVPTVSIEPVSEAAKRQSLLEKRTVEDGRLLIGRRGAIAELGDHAKKDYLTAESEPYTVSKRQCRIEIRGGEVWLVDLGSRHGTLVNGGRLGKRSGGPKKVRLERGVHTMIPGPLESEFVFSIVVE